MRLNIALPGTRRHAGRTLLSASPNLSSRSLVKMTGLLAALFLTLAAGAQSSANYAFSTSTTGSLVDMSSGTTQLVASSTDDGQSSVTDLPFGFWFMGTRYTQFSVNSNGLIRLGSTAVGTAGNTQIGSVASAPLISAFSFDIKTATNGKIHSKVTGTAPNRVFVIEFLNMQIGWNSGTSDGTFQVLLGEDGSIRFIYGEMLYRYVPGTTTVSAGFSSSNTNNTYATININTNAVTYSGGTTNYNLGSTVPTTVPVSSADNSSRRVYGFVPTAPSDAPTNLNFTNTTALGMTLTWTAPAPISNTLAYAIYSSTDGVTYSYAGSVPVGTTTFTANGLTPATNYWWQVFAVSEGAFSSPLTGSNPTLIPTVFTSTSTGGLWSQPATWESGTVPSPGDEVIIKDGATVTIDVNPIVSNLTIGEGTSGTLVYNPSAAQSLTVTGNLNILTGASFRAALPGSTSTITTHTLSIAGNLVNGGTIDFAATAGAGGTVVNASRVAVTFTGTNNANLDLTGASMSNFAGVTLNKGTSSAATLTYSAAASYLSAAGATSSGSTITVSSSSGLAVGMYVSVVSGTGVFPAGTRVTAVNSATQFTVSAAPSTALSANAVILGSTVSNLSAASPGFLTLSNGTFVAGGTEAYRAPIFATNGYSIPATAGFTVNNANAVITGLPGSPTLNGKLTMNAGAYNIGVVAGNEMGAGATANWIMNGGTVNLASRFNTASALTFNMSGGTINVTTVANATSSSAGFGMTSTAASFTISGGTINLVQASTGATQRDYYVAAANPNITGGTLNVGTAATATKFVFVVMGSMPNVVIDNTTNNKTAQLSGTSPAVAYGDVLVKSGTTLNLNGTSMTLRGATLTNNGIINGSASGSRLSFLSTGAQTFAGSGGLTTPLDGLIVRSGGGLNITHTNSFNTLRVELQNGTISNSNKIILGTGAALGVTVQTGYPGNSGAGGFFDVAPTFNLGTGSYTVSAQQESALRTLNLEIPASRSISSLIVNNSNGVTFNGALSTGTLTLTNGLLLTNSTDLLTVTGTTTGSVSGGSASSYVQGPLQRTLPASLATGSTYSFPVGKGSYNPLDLVNPVTNAGGTVVIRAEAFDGDAGGTAGSAFASLSNTRYWQVAVPTGSGNLTSTFIRLNDTRGSFDAIGSSATQNGTYTLVGGSSPVLATGSITSVAPAITSLPGFYLMALKSPPVLSNLAISPNTVNCTGSVPHTVSVDVAGGTAPYTAVLTYTVNGGGPQTVAMTQSGSTFSGTIPAVSPAGATVAWSVTVTDANTISSTLAGTPYRDAPLLGVSPVLQARPTTVCAGDSVTLTANPSFVERFETFPVTTFSATAPLTATQNSTYFAEGASSVRLSYTANIDAAYAMTQNFNLSGYTGAQLTFSHILATETGLDYGYVQYSTNGGSTWTSFPPSSYAGTGTLKNGVVSFDKTSYADWAANFTTSGVLPTNALWKNETINIPASALTSQFRVRFRMTSDGSVQYYGWLIDNVRIGLPGSGSFTSYLWHDGNSTTTNTYTYLPAASENAAVLGVDANGCTTDISNLVAITVNPLPAAPTAINSNQCGLAVPTASVTSNSGLATPTFLWYDAATGGTLLQTGASNTYGTAISATTTFYVSERNGATGCESVRVPVTVTVTTPDAVSAASNVNNVCPGVPVTLTATQTGNTQNYTYTWRASPAAGSGIPNSVTGASVTVTPTAGGTFVYTLTAVDGTCTATSTVSVTITAPPAITSITATSPVCPGAPISLAAQSVPAQAGTVSLGTATGTNAANSSSAAAYPTWFGNGRQQYLIRASELQALGLVAGNLTSLAFDVVTANGDPATLNGYTIKLMAVPSTTNAITTFQTGTFSTVWGPQNYTPVVGINTHTFTTPFNWDGTSNLVVDICFSNGVTGNASAQTKQTATSFASHVYYAADGAGGTGACASTAVTNTANMRPNMIIGGIAGTDVTSTYTWTWNPGNLSAASVTATAPANNTGAAITQVYTVTATNTTTGCSSDATVNVTVNATPATPTATNSTQCGLAVPMAMVTSTSGLASPTFNWYDAPTGGTLLQSGASATYTTAISATTVFYVSEVNSAGGCESARVPVTVTVSTPDAVTASSSGSICPNTAVTLTATQTGNTQNYTYTWTASPVAGSGIPNSVTGASVSVTPTASGVYTYTVTAVDGTCTASSTIDVNVKPSPAITTAVATPSTVCPDGSIALSATSIGVGAGTATVGAGATTTSTYPAPFYSLWSNKHMQIMFRASELTAANLRAGNITALNFPTTAGTVAIQNVTIKMANTTQNDMTTFVGSGFTTVFTAASLAQTANTNNRVALQTPFAWDGTSNVVIEICFGTSATSATLSSTSPADVTSFTSVIKTHVSAATAAATVCGNTTTNLLTYTTRPKVIFEGQAVANITSTYTWTWNPGNLSGASVTATAPANNTGAPITQVYTVTATDAAGNGCSTSATVNVTVNPTPASPTVANSTQCGYGIPTASVASNTGVATPSFNWYAAATGGTALQTGTQTTYQAAINATTTFYVSEVNTITGCESVRVPVTVTVTQPDAIDAVASQAAVCANGAITLSATQTGNTQNYTYTWTATPAAGSGIATSVSGASVTVNPTTAGSYRYMVTGVSGVCTTFDTVRVTVNANPQITSATGPSAAVCPGASVALTAESVPAVTGTFNIGTATGTNATNTSLAAAYPTWFGNGRQQYLIRASELQAQGVVPGNLTSLAFDVVTANGDPATLNGYTIKLMAVPAATNTITTIQTGSFTTVWGPQNYTPVVGINTHTFTTPFNWDGTSNLVVDICFSNGVTGNGSAQTKQTATAFASTVYYAADGTGGNGACTATTVLGSGSMRPNMIFVGRVGTVQTANYTWTWNPGNLSGASVTATAPANNTGAAITQVYTVTATNTGTGCFSTATVNVTVNATPATPTATNSAQCGLAVPTASVTSNSGLATPTFNWYTAATGGTPIQTGTQTTFQTAITTTTTYYVSEVNSSTGCESARVPVTVTVTQPDAVSIAPVAPVCLGNAVNLAATQTGSTNNYTYTWTAAPAGGSGISGSVTGATQTVTPTAAGSYVYTVTAFDPAGSCTVVTSTTVTVNANPAITSVSANPALVCPGGTVTLTASSSSIASGEVPIGAGATTTSTYPAPFYSLWSNKHMQIMFRASELTAANLRAGNITALNFPTTAGTVAIQNVTIKMANTTQTDMSTFVGSGFTTVFTAASLAQTANTNNRVVLQTSFAWDGTSNVVIEICFGTSATSATLSSTSPADVTSFTSVIKTHVSAATAAATVCGNTTTNLLTYTTRPKVIFEGQVITDITPTYTWTWNPGNLSGAQVVAPAPTTGGVHTYTVLATNNSTGCTSTATVNVTSGGTYTVAATSTPATICAGSSASLSATPSAAGLTYTYEWKDASNTVIGTSATLSVTPAATSTYTVTVTNNCGVVITQPVTVNVNPIPVTTPSQLTQTLCSGSTGTLSFSTQATVGVTTYTWTNSNPLIGLAASGTGAISFTATNSTASTQTATITVSAAYTNGGVTCTGPDATATIIVNPVPAVNAITGQTLCAGTTTSAVNFSGTPAGVTYAWTNDNPSIGLATSGTGNIASFTGVNSGSTPAVANITVTPQFTGAGQTCSGTTQTFSITVNPAASGTITAPNGSFICSGVTSVPLQATGGTSYQWLLNGNPIPGATGATYNATQTGNYSVIITNAQGCSGPSTNSIAVTLVPAPQADFSFSGYCLNAAVQFSNLTVNASAVSFQWNFGNGQTSTQAAPSTTYTQTGTYTVTLIAAPQGCPAITDTVTKTITIEAPIAGVRLAPVDVVSGRPTEIRARNLPNGHYSWTPATGLSNPAIWYPTATLTQEQEYRISVSFNSGCVTVDTLLVRVQKGDDIFVPTAFSPDGDGVNDVLRPITVGLTGFRSFRIFDRMGREIFATTSQAQGWDGTYRGQPLPAQTFVWVAEGRDSNGNIIRKTGQVLLVR